MRLPVRRAAPAARRSASARGRARSPSAAPPAASSAARASLRPTAQPYKNNSRPVPASVRSTLHTRTLQTLHYSTVGNKYCTILTISHNVFYE